MAIGLTLAFLRGHFYGAELQFVLSAIIIASLEISLSFDNAVINASKLKTMPVIWRRRFLTWGILIAVFGMRFVFPIAIVAVFSGISCMGVLDMALHDAKQYEFYLAQSHIGISSFGGTFLMMLFFEFMFDSNKQTHWIAPAEKLLKKIGRVKFAPLLCTVAALAIVEIFIPEHERLVSISAGLSGIIIHLLIHGISEKLESMAARKNAFALKHAGLAAFLYLELIDASFSLDGVLGAFALSRDVVVITIGLCIGAFFVRSITLLLVQKKTLEKLVYLTHGAYWAIGSLAAIMLISTIQAVPEAVTGGLGMALIIASLLSSLQKNGR